MQYKLLRIMILVQPERPAITHGLRAGIQTRTLFIGFHVGPVDMEPLNGRVRCVGSWWIGMVSFLVPVVNPETVGGVIIAARDSDSAVCVISLEACHMGHAL